MSTFKNIAIVGANGNVGKALVPILINKGFHVSAISRTDSKSVFPSAVAVIKTAFDVESLTKALKDQNAVIYAAPSQPLTQQESVVDAAVAAGVKWFIPSEFGHDCTDERVVEKLPPLKGKISIVKRLKEAESQGLSWTGVLTGLIFDWVR
jgi:saccharopine dehydrogenase-like NADP-dependent oxidoreductase